MARLARRLALPGSSRVSWLTTIPRIPCPRRDPGSTGSDGGWHGGARGACADTWVVAVSGGGDSVGLLRVLHQLAPSAGLRLSVAHLDHGVRGEAARADAAFVAELAESLGLPFDLGHGGRPAPATSSPTPGAPDTTGWSRSPDRAGRASWPSATRATTRPRRSCTASSAAPARAGWPASRARRPLAADPAIELVRPLLDVSRDEIRDYLRELGQPCREDASNADLTRTRARIRHDLLPRLAAEYNPKVAEALVRLGELAAIVPARDRGRRARDGDAAVITRSPDCLVLKHGSWGRSPPSSGPRCSADLAEAGWPEAGMSARRWRRLAALVRER